MDRLRFDVVEVDEDSGGGFAVEIFVNDVEMTAAGAGLGMDPYDVLVPDNAFVATAERRTIPVARLERDRQSHQIFVDIEWADRSPEQLATVVTDTLRTPPRRWRAAWSAMRREDGPPDIAAPDWKRHRP